MTEDRPAESELEKKALDMIEYLRDRISRGKETGVDFSEVEDLLMGARMMVDSGAYNDAMKLINQCTEMASQRFTDFELLNKALRKAREDIEEARTSGRDVSEAERLLKVARYHKKTGLYRMGADYARRASRNLEESGGEIEWGSALAGDS